MPTLKEAGYDLTEANGRGVGVPAKTPESVIKKLESAFLEVASNPDVQVEMSKQGLVPVAIGHKQLKEDIAKKMAIYKELLPSLK